MTDRPRFAVRFDDEAFAEDMHHATSAARDVGERERARSRARALRPVN